MAVILTDNDFDFAGENIGNLNNVVNLLESNLVSKKNYAFMPIESQASSGAVKGVENSGSSASIISADTGYAVIDVSEYRGRILLATLQGGSAMLGCGFSPTTQSKDMNYSVRGAGTGRNDITEQEVQVPSDAKYMYLTYYVSRYNEYKVVVS